MSGVLTMTAHRRLADSGLGSGVDTNDHGPESSVTDHEQIHANFTSEHGGLSFLFGDGEANLVPQPLETPTSATIVHNQTNELLAGAQLNGPNYSEQASAVNLAPAADALAAKPWTLLDTVKGEVAAAQARVTQLFAKGA